MSQSFMVSPGINVTEFNLANIIPSVASTDGALAGVFSWGPIGERMTVSSENILGSRVGGPSNFNAETWFTAADFLGYDATLHLVRAADTTGNTVHVVNASATVTNASANVTALSSTDTSGLVAGMLLFSSNTTSLSSTPGHEAKIVSVNSSAIVLSSAATAGATGVNLVFRDNITYAAVAQETADATISWAGQTVLNDADYVNHDGNFASSVNWVARYGGSKGNSLRLSQCDSAAQFSSVLNLGAGNTSINATGTSVNAVVGSANLVFTFVPASSANGTVANTIAGTIKSDIAVNDLLQVGNSSIGYQFLKVASVSSITNTTNTFSFTVTLDDNYTLAANVSANAITRYWEFYNLVDIAPGQTDYVASFGNTSANDELHVVIVDEKGSFTQTPGTVLEVYRNLSRASDAKGADGSSNYYKTIINQQSQYVRYANDRSLAVSNTANYVTSSSAAAPLNVQFYGGGDGLDEANIPLARIIDGYNLFLNTENVDVSLIMQGKARGSSVSSNTDLASYLINNIAAIRKDCVVFVSPDKDLVVNNKYNEVTAMVAARDILPDSSYAFMDSGYKYRYDRYNDINRWTPLNGDIAGLCGRTDQTNAPWWSPGGFTRGQIKNVIKLAFNPGQTDRDTLYKKSINPVITKPGMGTILFGDKTLLSRPSAFDRINVRRLFIVLEKAISTAAQYMLFEFNDDFTRAQFKSMVNPYLASVEGQRGIYDYLVVCDNTNNTPEVIDANQFVGDIYIKPAKSVNFIQLNFVAVSTGVAFNEVVGKFN